MQNVADKISRAVLLKVQCICGLPGDFFKVKILNQEWGMRFCISSHKLPGAAMCWSIEKSLDNNALITYDYKMNKLLEVKTSARNILLLQTNPWPCSLNARRGLRSLQQIFLGRFSAPWAGSLSEQKGALDQQRWWLFGKLTRNLERIAKVLRNWSYVGLESY